MSEDGFDRLGISAFQNLAETRGEGLLPAFSEHLGHTLVKNEVTICEIVTLPALHQRKTATIYQPSTGASALVLAFPAPRWQRNASARS